MDKTILLQKQVRDNSDDLRSYLHDLEQWEDDMKRKESEISSEYDIPKVPIPRKSKKIHEDKQVKNDSKVKKRISSYDYAAWDKFDVDEECQKIDKRGEQEEDSEDEDPVEEHNTLLRDEANYEKDRGNKFVQNKKWDEAISCYTHSIACYSKDPIYFANRALCFLKKNDLKSAEADCTSALQLEPNYVKALQRRAFARESLKQYADAVSDLKRILEIEPHNKESKTKLEKLQKQLGIKSTIKKSEDFSKPSTSKAGLLKTEDITPVLELEKEIIKNNKIDKCPQAEKPKNKEKTTIVKQIPWPVRTSSEIILPIQKLPHQRSKKPLRRIEILESDNSDTELHLQQKTEEHLNKNIDYSDSNTLAQILAQSSDINVDKIFDNIENKVIQDHTKDIIINKEDIQKREIVENKNESLVSIDINSKDSVKIENSFNKIENHETTISEFSVPKSSLQFHSNWRMMRDINARFSYLKNINPVNIPTIFENSLESDIFSQIITVLKEKFIEHKIPVYLYLLYLSKVKRFSMLVMFTTAQDKIALREIFEYCENTEETKENINLLKILFEL